MRGQRTSALQEAPTNVPLYQQQAVPPSSSLAAGLPTADMHGSQQPSPPTSRLVRPFAARVCSADDTTTISPAQCVASAAAARAGTAIHHTSGTDVVKGSCKSAQSLRYQNSARLADCRLVPAPRTLALFYRARAALLMLFLEAQAELSASLPPPMSYTWAFPALVHPAFQSCRRAAAVDAMFTVLSAPAREALEPLATPGQVSASWPCLDC